MLAVEFARKCTIMAAHPRAHKIETSRVPLGVISPIAASTLLFLPLSYVNPFAAFSITRLYLLPRWLKLCRCLDQVPEQNSTKSLPPPPPPIFVINRCFQWVKSSTQFRSTQYQAPVPSASAALDDCRSSLSNYLRTQTVVPDPPSC